MVELRPDLPEPPTRIARLPVHRGFPVPWFVVWVEEEGSEVRTPIGVGYPEFRMLDPERWVRAHNEKRCFVCGDVLGVHKVFPAGPMCGITRTSAEPPSHYECAEWSVRACPFMTRPHMERREGGLPEAKSHAGVMIMRNPGVTMLWVTRSYKVVPDGGGSFLFRFGDPERVEWYAEGRAATRAEVDASIEAGMPELRSRAQTDVLAAQLDSYIARFEPWLPHE